MLEKEKLNTLLNIPSEWFEEEEEEEEEEEVENEQENDNEEVDQEEDAEEYFNPFAEKKDDVIKSDDEEEEQESKGIEKKEVANEDRQENYADSEARAKLDAIDLVDEYIEQNPDFSDLKKTLREYTSKAILQGHAKPLEFALRNAKSPEYWINLGKKMGVEGAQQALGTRMGGRSGGAGSSQKADFDSMPSNEFNDYVNKVISGN
jgi:hypothetical protein